MELYPNSSIVKIRLLQQSVTRGLEIGETKLMFAILHMFPISVLYLGAIKGQLTLRLSQDGNEKSAVPALRSWYPSPRSTQRALVNE